MQIQPLFVMKKRIVSYEMQSHLERKQLYPLIQLVYEQYWHVLNLRSVYGFADVKVIKGLVSTFFRIL